MTSTEPSHAISEIALLAAYEVHHTGTEDEQRAIDEIHSESSTQEQTDGNWLTGYRGVPIYRSTNRQADYWDRAAGTNRVEGAFVVTAFFGLYINAVCSVYSINPNDILLIVVITGHHTYLAKDWWQDQRQNIQIRGGRGVVINDGLSTLLNCIERLQSCKSHFDCGSPSPASP